jgi:hypothetical protein
MGFWQTGQRAGPHDTRAELGSGRRDGQVGRGGLQHQGNLRRGHATAAGGKLFFILPSLGGAGVICARSLSPGCGLVSIVSSPHAGRLEGASDRPEFETIKPETAPVASDCKSSTCRSVTWKQPTLARRTQGFSSRRGLFFILHSLWLWRTSSGVNVTFSRPLSEPTPFRPSAARTRHLTFLRFSA